MQKIIKYELLFIFIFTVLVLFGGVTFGILFFAGVAQTLILIFLLHIAYKNTGDTRFQTARRSIGVLFLLFIVSFGIVEGLLLKTAVQSHHIREEAPDAVIILGAGLKGHELSNTLRERLEKGRELLTVNENVPVVVSGGQGPGEAIPEADAMGAYLKTHGIREDRIYYDKTSTTTYENLRNAEAILRHEGLHNKKVIIVTSDYHILRAEKISEELGLDCTGLGSESPLLITANYIIREYFAVVNMMLN
ncbi:YdcF family protein [Bacillus sp. AFS015802]|uniref:YdcF family protein n=1 Tax=Bacillus sp. AFS015802 TaxID=2033486 RepID=UPI0015CF0284|nr:YdcF family protein [Bacillus sp. AFS015802]